MTTYRIAGFGSLDLSLGRRAKITKWQMAKRLFRVWVYGGKKELAELIYFIYPLQFQTPPDETQAALVKSTGSFCDYVLNLDVKTVKQLRENTPPNAWETAWILFRYTDTFHYYWFLVKPNGIELGKKDCDTCSDPVDGQQFLVTKETCKLNLNQWAHWKIDVVGNHIMISVNGITGN